MGGGGMGGMGGMGGGLMGMVEGMMQQGGQHGAGGGQGQGIMGMVENMLEGGGAGGGAGRHSGNSNQGGMPGQQVRSPGLHCFYKVHYKGTDQPFINLFRTMVVSKEEWVALAKAISKVEGLSANNMASKARTIRKAGTASKAITVSRAGMASKAITVSRAGTAIKVASLAAVKEDTAVKGAGSRKWVVSKVVAMKEAVANIITTTRFKGGRMGDGP